MTGTTSLEPFPSERFTKFCDNLKILTKDFGLMQFKLLGSQQYILDEIIKGMNEGISTYVILKSRQLGSSTFFMALDLFWMFQYAGASGAIITHTEQLRDQFKYMVEVYLAHLPKAYRVPKRNHNRNLLTLKNGSTWQYLIAGTKETSKGMLGTGGAFNYLHCSEVSAYGSPEDLKNLRAAMSSHYPHRLQIYETTARGFNHFSDMWEQAVGSPTQRVIFVGWWRNELFRYEQGEMHFQAYMPEGDKTTMHVLERKRMRLVKEMYGFEIKPEQIAWYRWKLNDEYEGDQSKMDEDFPWTPDDAFVATGSRFFTNDSITDQMRRARGALLMPFKYTLGYSWTETKLDQVAPKRADLRIWEEMNPFGRYVVSCDPAYGSSDEADRTVIAVFRCYADKCVQVAEYCSPLTSTHQCAWILAHMCGYYRNVRMILEIAGPGQAVDAELKKLKMEMANMFPSTDDVILRNCLSGMQAFLWRRGDSFSGSVMYQWKGNMDQKRRMMNRLKDSVELDRCEIYSQGCLEEMKTIIYDQGSIEAEVGKKDDRVIAAGLANFAWLEWEQGPLRNQGMTMLRAKELQSDNGGEAQKNRMVLNYLQKLA